MNTSVRPIPPCHDLGLHLPLPLCEARILRYKALRRVAWTRLILQYLPFRPVLPLRNARKQCSHFVVSFIPLEFDLFELILEFVLAPFDLGKFFFHSEKFKHCQHRYHFGSQ